MNQYRTCLVWISDVFGIHSFSGTAPNLLLSISIFQPNCRYQIEMTRYTENLLRARATQISNEMRIETRYLFYWSSDSFESYSLLRGLRATQRRLALEGTTKVTLAKVFSNSFSFSTSWFWGNGIDRYKLSESHHNLSGALRRRLAV